MQVDDKRAVQLGAIGIRIQAAAEQEDDDGEGSADDAHHTIAGEGWLSPAHQPRNGGGGGAKPDVEASSRRSTPTPSPCPSEPGLLSQHYGKDSVRLPCLYSISTFVAIWPRSHRAMNATTDDLRLRDFSMMNAPNSLPLVGYEM